MGRKQEATASAAYICNRKDTSHPRRRVFFDEYRIYQHAAPIQIYLIAATAARNSKQNARGILRTARCETKYTAWLLN